MLVAISGVAPGVSAQTAAQLEVFRALPPAQQQQILQQVTDRRATDPAPGLAPAAPTSTEKTDGVAEQLADSLEKVPRLRGEDEVLLDLVLRDTDNRSAMEFRQRLLAGNPYRLDQQGQLRLHDGTLLGLAGLTAGEAVARLNAEPRLAGLTFTLRLLPIDPVIKPFGYDLFTHVPSTFAPATDIPVPAEYVMGPGDTLEVLLIGERGGRYSLTVGRDGAVDFPELGPIAVAGLPFAAAKDLLEQRVAEQMIGMRGSVSMGTLRSIQVFVLGEAERPGSYTVSGLSTITNALFASGGVKPIGSLRDIQLKRNGKVVRTFDLYDLLLNGDTSHDERLLPGDVIFIPTAGVRVAIDGEVQRPAIYEIKPGTVATEILALAGGLTPTADPSRATLERIDGQRTRMVKDLDFTSAEARSLRLQSGDSIRVRPIIDSLEGVVSLAGHVYRPAQVQYRSGMRLTDLVGSMDELQPMADANYVLIRRESGPTRRVSVLSADLEAAFANPGSSSDPELRARDQVYVFDLASSRDRTIDPILAELDRQSGRDEPRQSVSISGRVKVSGEYPLEPGMTLADLLRAGGGLDQAAYGGSAELTRYRVRDGQQRETEVIEVDLSAVLAGNPQANLALQPFDYLVVRETPDWRDQEFITIGGEVRFPGRYPIRRNETLRSVIERAGGLTEFAFAEGSVFTRAELKAREQRQLKVLAERMQRELASLALQQSAGADNSQVGQALAAGESLLADLQDAEAVGRLVLDLDAVLDVSEGPNGGVLVRDGDTLYIPRLTQEVTVIGEVQGATSHLWRPGLTRRDYIDRSGGFTVRADEKRVFVIRANGQVEMGLTSGWFGRGDLQDIRPGDTVVVPLDAQQVRPLTLWTSVTQILYNIAVAVAAVNSF